MRYFSGTATYSRTFLLPKGWNKPQRRVVLDLGTVRNLAEVKINGHKAGLLLASPFQLEISDFLQPGTNRIEIAVTNLWVNRLIGDAAIPPLFQKRTAGRLGIGRQAQLRPGHLHFFARKVGTKRSRCNLRG